MPVVLDVTHSNQKPNQSIGKSGGTPEFIETISLCSGVAAGAKWGFFRKLIRILKKLLSDGTNMLPFK